tara:strand:- start:4198 stop:4347 length:150 start_codon:yes stop_codon:yes gene_type:complete
MIDRLKIIKKNMIINLGYMGLVIKDIENIKDKRLNSNKLNKKSWLKRLY